MERLDFIRKLFMLYGKSTEKNIDLIRDYDLALSEEQNIDWAKMLRLVEKSDLNSLPHPKYFKSLIPKCRIEVEGQYKYDNGTGVLRLKDEKLKARTGYNRFYVFDMWHTTHTIDEIYNHFKAKYGSKFIDFKYYPEEFSIIGRKIFDHNMQQCGVIE